MLMPTEIIFLVVMTKGTICCLNSFIILYIKICPIKAKPAINNKCRINKGWLHENSIKTIKLPDKIQYIKESKLHHLFI